MFIPKILMDIFYSFENSGIEKVTFESGTKKISSSAFSGSVNLKEVYIPETVTETGYGAFCNCTSLKNITLPDSIKIIGRNSLKGSTGFESLVLPDSITNIVDKENKSTQPINKGFVDFLIPE